MAKADVIRQAKDEYEQAKRNGDSSGMANARIKADKARGYRTTTKVVDGEYKQVKFGASPEVNGKLQKATVELNKPKPLPKANVAPWGSVQDSYNKSLPGINTKQLPKTNLLNDAFDSKENYVDKFKQGNIGGGVANIAGGMITGSKSVYLNAWNAGDSLASGKGLPKFQTNMSKDMYNMEIVKRDAKPENFLVDPYANAQIKTIKDKISDKNKILGGVYGFVDETLSDPIELTPAGYLNDIKLAKGTNQATQAYGDLLKSNKLSPQEAVASMANKANVSEQTINDALKNGDKGVIEAVEKEMKSVEVKKPVTKPMTKPLITPNSKTTAKSEGLFVDYHPERRAIDTVNSNDFHSASIEEGFNPEEYITVYRGAPKNQKSINNGDWVTTLKELAESYTGDGKIIKDKIQAKYLYAPKGEGIEEMIYSTNKKLNQFKGTPQPLPKATQTMPQAPKLPVQPVKDNLGMNVPKEQVFAEKPYVPKLGERVINLERGNQGKIAKLNQDGSYLVHFKNKETGKEVLIKMQRDEFEPINQTIMDLKQATKVDENFNSHDNFNKAFSENHDRELQAFINDTKDYAAVDSGVGDFAKDITGKGVKRHKDFQRNKEAAFRNSPEGRKWFEDTFERNMYKSKGEYAKQSGAQADKLWDEVVKPLGINKNSKESQGLQWYGDKAKQRRDGKVLSNKTTPYGLEDLKAEFNYKMPNGKMAWENIVEADKFAEKMYLDYVPRINESLKKMFPDVEKNVEELKRPAKDKITITKAKIANQADLINGIKEQLEKQEGTLNSKNKLDTKVATGLKNTIENSRVRLKNAETELERLNARLELNNREFVESKLKTGDKVHTNTRGNVGKIVAENQDGTFQVYFRNSETGKEATVRLPEEELISNATWQKIEDATVGKRLMPRKDYRPHMKEMQQQGFFVGLDNIVNSATNIDPRMIPVTEFAKPKSKFTGFMQRRKDGDTYREDAISGMLDYIRQAEYKINIEPNIPVLRGIIKDLSEATIESKNANSFIDEMIQVANDLAGKTNNWDRSFINIFGDERGRKILNSLTKVSGTMRANAVMGNINTLLAQPYNMANVVGYAKNPDDIAKGFEMSTRAMAGDKEALAMLDKSFYLKERFLDRSFRRFDKDVVSNAGNFMSWSMEVGDKAVADGAFLTFYRQAIKKGMEGEDAVLWADEFTRKSTAGRGIAEMPLSQKAKVTKLFAPFQVEVRNAINVQSDLWGAKDFGGVAAVFITTFIMNEILEATTGRRIGLDPIDVIRDVAVSAYKGETTGANIAKNAAYGLGGNVLTNMPGGSYMADIGAGALGLNDYTMSKLFGQNDPSRFGTGNIALQTLAAPIGQAMTGRDIDLLKPLMATLPKFGGKQIERGIRGLQDMAVIPREKINLTDGVSLKKQEFPASYSQSGRLRFAVEDNLKNNIIAPTLGTWSTKEGKNYIKNGNKAMGEKQTSNIQTLAKSGMTGTEAEKFVKAFPKTIEEQRNSILNSNLTLPQKQAADKLVNSKRTVDYTNKTNFEFSNLTDSKIENYSQVSNTGITKAQFLNMVKTADGDGNGSIKKDELKAVMIKAGLTSEQRRAMYIAWNWKDE